MFDKCLIFGFQSKHYKKEVSEVAFLHPKNSFFLFQQHTKMFNLDVITKKNNRKKWPYRMLIIGPSGSGKTNALPNYLYAKDLSEPKYQFLIKKREDAGIKN